jgi:glycosyltransferase involved in cell wall biosynthesis
MKTLAVLMPTYNYERYLLESISSILNQTFIDFDLYIYDDGSNDKTEEVVAKFKDKRIKYIKNNENIGLSRTLNKGLDKLCLEYTYIARMDADDWAYPERFEKQITFLNRNKKIGLCGTQAYCSTFNDDTDYTRWTYPLHDELLRIELLFSASFWHPSIVLRSSVIQKYGIRYDIFKESTEDWDMWIKISEHTELANLPDYLIKYRIHSNSNHRSIDKLERHYAERADIISSYWNKLTEITNKEMKLTSEDIKYLYYNNEVENTELGEKKLNILLKFIDNLNILNNKMDNNKTIHRRIELQLLRILDNMKLPTLVKYQYYNKLDNRNLLHFIKRYLRKIV